MPNDGGTRVDVVRPDVTKPAHLVRVTFGEIVIDVPPAQACQLGTVLVQLGAVAGERERLATPAGERSPSLLVV